MDELGYDVEWQLLNSKHFGVPQNRERVFIIGHFRGEPTKKVFPIIQDGGTPFGAERHEVHTANTLAAGDRESVGVYPLSDGGGTQSQRLSQGIVLNAYKPPKPTNISCTLDTKCGAVPWFNATYIIEENTDGSETD